jgi:hypothetical protein
VKRWAQAWRDGNRSGALASLLSAAVLAEASRRETGSPFACLNSTSHWIWGDEAARHEAASLSHTAAGYLIHHAASCFWGVLYERMVGERTDRLPPGAKVAAGLAAAGFACLVDYRLVPHRLTPGFEFRLSRRSIAAGYFAFGLGLALAGMGRAEQHRRSRPHMPTCAASGPGRPAGTA